MIANIIAHLLLNEAIGAYSRKKVQERAHQMIEEVEQYYMTFFGEIFLIDERDWILKNKIRPIVSRMSGRELADIIKIRKKNNKLIKRKKPIQVVLVDKETIRQYHFEYYNFKQKEAKRKEEIAEEKRKNIENEKLYKKHVFEFGESDTEIIDKFFG